MIYNYLENNLCPHCGEDGCLRYYKELNKFCDLYFCQKTYKIVEFDGEKKNAISQEAYPDRDKIL